MKLTQASLLIASILALNIPTAQANEGATVVSEFGCSLLAADSGLPMTLFTDDVTHAVVTPSGNSVLQCHFDIPEGYEPTSTLHHEGFACSTYLGLTYDSSSVATKGGKAHLKCQVKHD